MIFPLSLIPYPLSLENPLSSSLSASAQTDRIQGRLFLLAGLFMFFYAASLTLSPAVRARSWQVSYRWDHWIAVGVWAALFWVVHRETSRRLPARDPYLVPIAGLLSGWGVLTIWRLSPAVGLRQTLWLGFILLLLLAGLRLPAGLGFLRRYKYLWLTGGLLLTGLTIFLGTNPSGGGLPRLWLGCCGVYFQPSEPLKLLLLIYLAAYLADRLVAGSAQFTSLLPLLAPTLLMTGLALLLLVVQRDLGTASIFLFLYAIMVYVATGRTRILVASGLAVALAAVAGYVLFDVVKLRVDAWLNPWIDPAGRSYQIVQSLLAIANGGLFGRGPGLGSPSLVPVPQSDFIYASITEETGLTGAVGILLLLALLASRGVRSAFCAPDAFRRYLAAGLVAFLVGQSILIIGGNLRLMPLTGVTLPFVSYGGSSLLTSFLSLLLLLHISTQAKGRPAPLSQSRPYLFLGALLLAGLAVAALLTGWWTLYRGPGLLSRTDNARRAISDRFVSRGSLLDRNNQPIVVSQGEPGELARHSLDPQSGSVIGYNHPIYGQSGLEASLDPYLRGLVGNPASLIWWDQLIYGQPPPGLDVRLSLDQGLQHIADQQLADQGGAVVLLDAKAGDILAMASHPTFDPNRLDLLWPDLVTDPRSPLLDRATQGQYQPGSSLGPLFLAAVSGQGKLPALPASFSYRLDSGLIDCAQQPAEHAWGSAVQSGCPGAVAALGNAFIAAGSDPGNGLIAQFQKFGLYSDPSIRLATASVQLPKTVGDPAAAVVGQSNLLVSPLQMALAAAALTGDGLRPAPRLVMDVKTPQAGWVMLPDLDSPVRVFSPGVTPPVVESLSARDQLTWETVATAYNGEQTLTWYLGGTLPGWNGTPVAIAVLIEEDRPDLAKEIGRAVLKAALFP